MSSSYAGGIENFGPVTLTNVTIDGNSASKHGGGIDNFGPATLNNSIVANNASGGDFYAGSGSSFSGDNNLIDDAASTGGFSNGINGNIVGVNPLLTLGNYGTTIQTMPLLPGSPAIDAGSTAHAVDAHGKPLITDEPGLPRVVGTAVDIGAVESSGFTLAVASGNNQSTVVRTAFPNALQVTVTPITPVTPSMVVS